MNLAELNRNLTNFEQTLNIAGYIPVVQNFSGPLRAIYGKLEVIASIVGAAFYAIKSLFTGSGRDREMVATMLNYTVHGIANIFRGYVETLFFVLSTGACLLYDRCFQLRMAYPGEPSKKFDLSFSS